MSIEEIVRLVFAASDRATMLGCHTAEEHIQRTIREIESRRDEARQLTELFKASV